MHSDPLHDIFLEVVCNADSIPGDRRNSVNEDPARYSQKGSWIVNKPHSKRGDFKSLSKSSSSQVSACFPSSSTFAVLTALFVCSSLVCVCIHPLTSGLAVTTLTPHFSPCFKFVHAFVYLHPSHTPFASSSPGSADHLPSSMCSMSVSTFILPHPPYSYPPFNVSVDLR